MFSQGSSIRACGVIPDGVDFMIAENGVGVAAFHHVANGVQNLANVRATINVVTEEHSLAPLGVAIAAGSQLIAELVEESPEIQGTAVDVSDDVE